jgi:hypothetical protein
MDVLQRIDMRAPASQPIIPSVHNTGVWIQLNGRDGQALYQCALRTPQVDSLEVFEDEKSGAIRRVPATRKTAKLDAIVPDLPDVAELVLYGPANLRNLQAPSVPLLRSSSEELRREAARSQQPSGNNPQRRGGDTP